ncbi:chorismate mutase [Streptomyces sp. AJS327]|uniref:chorismate mutase n=1 Tax=Streptomyces sp. AJS327 TaxID=2545265 RepID=UPI0015DE8675|nr:chorismate mutase [Streptomyces sp. AJS327]MBA0054279.1 chorismate mutase [Streptomyces sp. AJS327]
MRTPDTVNEPATPAAPVAPAPREARAADRAPAETPDGAASGSALAAARRRIDELDAQLVALVRERMVTAAQVQRERLASGGRRVHLSRELEVLEHYRAAFGRPGTQLAMVLLGLCRDRP